jgi:hypothetical protein
MRRFSIARKIRMRVTAPPPQWCYQQHDFEQEAFVAVEKLAAEIERISGGAPIPGGGG